MNPAIILAAFLAADSFSQYERKDFDALYARQDARIAAYARDTLAAQPPEKRFPRGNRKLYAKPVPLSKNAKRMLNEIWQALK